MVTTASLETFAGVLHRDASADILRSGGIVPEGRSSKDLVQAVVDRIAVLEMRAGISRRLSVADSFGQDIEAGRAILGSPALTNIWHDERPLASCSAVPGAQQPVASMLSDAERYYGLNMGSGYNFDGYPDPAGALREMNSTPAPFKACHRASGTSATWATLPGVGDQRKSRFVISESRGHGGGGCFGATSSRRTRVRANVVERLREAFQGPPYATGRVPSIPA